MSIYTFNETGMINLSLTVANLENIVTIYRSPLKTERTAGERNELLSLNTFVKNLRATSKIRSIAEAELPNMELTDSDTTRLIKSLAVEWESPRKELDVYVSRSDTAPWMFVASISLLNPSGYPYRQHGLMDVFTDGISVEMGSGSKLGCAINDVGYGYLGAEDTFTIFGTYIEEYVCTEKPEPLITSCLNYAWNVSAASTALLPANSNRKKIILQNFSNGVVYFSFGQPAILGRGIGLEANGSSIDFSIDELNFKGTINAITSIPTIGSPVIGIECV